MRDLTVQKVEQLDHVKASFPQKAIGLHIVIRIRLAYFLANTPLLSEFLYHRFVLPTIQALKIKLKRLE